MPDSQMQLIDEIDRFLIAAEAALSPRGGGAWLNWRNDLAAARNRIAEVRSRSPGIAKAPDGTKPCGHCRNENLCVEIHTEKYPGMTGFAVRCGFAFCGARGPIRPMQMDAVDEWNKIHDWYATSSESSPAARGTQATGDGDTPLQLACDMSIGQCSWVTEFPGTANCIDASKPLSHRCPYCRARMLVEALKSPPPPAAARTEEVECDTCGRVAGQYESAGVSCCTFDSSRANDNCPGTLRAKAATFFSAEERFTRQNAREAVAAWREWWTPRWTRKVDEQESMTAFLAGWATKELRAKAQAVRLVCSVCKLPDVMAVHSNPRMHGTAGDGCARRVHIGGGNCPGVLVVASAGEETNDGK